MTRPIPIAALLLALTATAVVHADTVAITGVRLIDGRGGEPVDNVTMIITNGRFDAVGPAAPVPAGARVLDYHGRYVMPGMITDHSHIGLVDGVEVTSKAYNREIIDAQLGEYCRYGITTVTSLSNNAPLFDDLRKEAHAHRIACADLFGADQGIGVPRGAPPKSMLDVGEDQVNRPTTVDEAVADVRRMASTKTDLVKLWLDDFGGLVPVKMKPEIYRAVIAESHRLGLRIAVHIHDLADAEAVVDAGADIIAHGVRDQPVPPEFVAKMKARGVWYIATLQLDEATFAWAAQESWTQSAFARAAVSPEFVKRIDDPAWRAKKLADPMTEAARKSLAMNMRNLKTLWEAGVNIGFGTDSGATPDRVPGIAEHRELALTVLAGLKPLEAISLATANAAALMNLRDRGTIEPGKLADFVVLSADPSIDIGNADHIVETWSMGKPARSTTSHWYGFGKVVAQREFESKRRSVVALPDA